MIEEGTILQERYRIGKHIGQGGMGAVYIATDERFNNTVAIKETLSGDEHFKKAFKREARLLNSLKHSALPKVSDYFIENNGQYIVMEYIDGDDLYEKMEKSGKAFPLDDVLDWAKQLLDALEYLHHQENPVVHRDIKPQNLKLTSEGQIILLDFGLAKGNPTDANHQTAANSIFGYSRNYASLEQMQGTGTDPRSDIYSLAATLYHLVTGKPPVDALTRVMNVMNDEGDPLEPANKVHEWIPEDISYALHQSMSLKANLRPQSAFEMRQMLFEGLKKDVVSTRQTAAERALATDLLAQNTKMMSADAQSSDESEKSEMKTAILSGDDTGQDSIETKIAKSGTEFSAKNNTGNLGVITESSPNRKPLVATAVAGFLALFGTVVAGVYVFNPTVAESDNTDNEVNVEAKKETSNTSIGNSNIELVDTNSSVENEEAKTTEKAPPKESGKQTDKQVTKKNETPKVVKENNKPKDKKENVLQTKKTFVTINGVTIKDGKIVTKDGTVITQDRIKTKDGFVIDSKTGKVIGIDRRRPPRRQRPPRPPKGFPRKDYEKLSPQEKRRLNENRKKWLEELKKRKKKNQPLPPPSPKPQG